MKNIKQSIIENIDHLSDKQLQFINDLLNLPTYCGKGDLMKLANMTDTNKIDTATPIDYYRSIEEIYPNFNKGNMVFDYRENNFGRMLNVNDCLADRILKLNQ